MSAEFAYLEGMFFVGPGDNPLVGLQAMTEVVQASSKDSKRFVVIVDVASALDATYGLFRARIRVARVPIKSNSQIAQIGRRFYECSCHDAPVG